MKKTLYIEGMSCNHCKATVEKALGALDGVKEAVVNLEEKKADVELEKEVSEDILKAAVVDAGYEVLDIK